MDKWLCGDRQDIEILIKKHRKNRQSILTMEDAWSLDFYASGQFNSGGYSKLSLSFFISTKPNTVGS